MNNLSWRLSLAAFCAALTLFGGRQPVGAAEEDRGGPGDRLERLERRVNELAQRQEQMMRRVGVEQERMRPIIAPGREDFRPPMAGPGRPGIGEPAPLVGVPPAMGAPEPGVAPLPSVKAGKALHDLLGLFLLVALLFNILAAIWIFSDIRKRGEGPGIFVALALIAGAPAALIYAVVRLGDKKT
jgi:hypothetical protein